jgi:hypothetical protein
MWLQPRTHLGLPTSRPATALPVGRWQSTEKSLPQDLSDPELQFRFDDLPVSEHPHRIILGHFAAPGILVGAPLTNKFHMTSIDAYHDASTKAEEAREGERSAVFQQFSPDVTCRMVAKIAHGAAVAELGMGAFDAFLPDIIMGRSPYISHFVGSNRRRGRKKTTLHEITLDVTGGYLVANVQLFAKFGFRAYQAVVGRLRPSSGILHISTTLTNPYAAAIKLPI